MKPIKIAVLDDHSLILEAIKSLVEVETSIAYIGGFQSSTTFFTFLEQNQPPDVLLLDIQLDKEDGLQVAAKILQNHPKIAIVMLSSITQPSIVLNTLKKGAKGYLPKNISLEDLKDACQTVTDGRTYLHREISLLPETKKISPYDYIPKLTRREKEVLNLIMKEKTTAEIAEDLCVSTSTIETHRASLFSKTGVKNVVGLIKVTLEKGLLD